MAEKSPNIIAAYDKNRLIGGGGELPWHGELPADMKHFRAVTIGQIVVMGRATYESIGRPLPERRNIVVSRSSDKNFDGCETISAPEELDDMIKNDGREAYIIGGGQIYELFLPRSKKVIATEIEAEFTGDTYFPLLDGAWKEFGREKHRADGRNKYDYSFVIYEREK